MIKLRIKKGDTVKVLSGKDRGKTGKIIEVMPKAGKVVVDSVNSHTRFERSRKAGQPGKKVTFFAPLSISKVQLIDGSSGKPTRTTYTFLENGNKQRIAKVSKKAV